jgi:hypothetical protein
MMSMLDSSKELSRSSAADSSSSSSFSSVLTHGRDWPATCRTAADVSGGRLVAYTPSVTHEGGIVRHEVLDTQFRKRMAASASREVRRRRKTCF